MALSREELEREYRLALRRHVHLMQRNQELEEILLRMKGKSLMHIQEIDTELQRLQRDDERHTTEDDLQRFEANRQVISHRPTKS